VEGDIAILPGSQWYYDNVVGEKFLSLTEELTAAFKDFLLSGRLDQSDYVKFYKEGRFGFWYRSGNHYQFLKGMAAALGCNLNDYFERISNLCQTEKFTQWASNQYYPEFKVVAQLAQILALDGGSAMESLAPVYWRLLGRTVNDRLNRYLVSGVLEYPPYNNISFKTAIIGHNHLVRKVEHHNGRRLIYTGSTKPQTKINQDSLIAETEIAGGYAIIEKGNVCLSRLTPEIEKLKLTELNWQPQVFAPIEN
jgi:hypothetical protein